MYKLILEKAEEPEIKLPTPVESQKKQENSRKASTSASLTKLNECQFHWEIFTLKFTADIVIVNLINIDML